MEHDTREEIEESLSHVIPQKPFPQYIDDSVLFEVQELLASHPDMPKKVWSESPRLYTLLRMLGCHDDSHIFQKLEAEQIGDFWLPLGPSLLAQLPALKGPSPQEWRHAQRSILSRPEMMSTKELLSPAHTHRCFRSGASHFEDEGMIGEGGSAKVVRVRHKSSGKEYACKRITRRESIKEQRTQLIEFKQELAVLRRVAHHHLVSFVASYTDSESFSIILSPVAEQALKSVLEKQSRESLLPDSDLYILRRAFGCLATTIAFLHKEKIRHKDIKPGNILLKDGRVYLCDFGISRDWSLSDASTTDGDVLKYTRRYVAPEVFDKEPRNTAADIWSLGCVYLEMLSVIKEYPLHEVNQFLSQNSIGFEERGLHSAPEAIKAWLTKIRSERNDSADDMPIDWITQMIRTDAKTRIDAFALVKEIREQSAYLPHANLFVGPCCSRTDSVTPYNSPKLLDPEYMDVVPFYPPSSQLSNKRHKDRFSSSIEERSRDSSVSPRTTTLDNRNHTENTSVSLRPNSVDGIQSDASDAGNRTQHIPTSPRSHEESSLSHTYFEESEIPSAIYPRRDIPSPATFQVTCSCGPRINERHIFNGVYAIANTESGTAPFQVISETPTIESCSCEVGANKIQIYETPPQDPNNSASQPMLWWVTRRLVVSHLVGNPEFRRCSSFWLPLADMQFTLMGETVTLAWSDCSQVTRRESGDYSWRYDWKYKPNDPNNNISIRFNNVNEAQQFVNAVRLPYEDGEIVSRGRRVEISDHSEVSIFDVGRPDVRNYRVATLTTSSPTILISKFYIILPEADIDICIIDSSHRGRLSMADYEMVVTLNNVTTPMYQSDTCDEPAEDDEKVARFQRAIKVKAAMHATFPLDPHPGLLVPPNAVDMLHALTGWTLRYFAIVAKLRSKKKHFGSKSYGGADIMLWVRDDKRTRQRKSTLTFRLHGDEEFLWMSADINHNTEINTSGNDAIITVSNKARGRLLDMTRMTAIASEVQNQTSPGLQHSRTRSTSSENDVSELVLTFEDKGYRLGLLNLIEEFREPAPLFEGSFRRISSLASDRGPPIRWNN